MNEISIFFFFLHRFTSIFRFNGEKSLSAYDHLRISRQAVIRWLKLSITRPQTSTLISPIIRPISVIKSAIVFIWGARDDRFFNICRTEQSDWPNTCERRPVDFRRLESTSVGPTHTFNFNNRATCLKFSH